MHSVLDRKLVVVTGKGGVGKTTIAAAIGLLASERARRTIIVEVGAESRLPALFSVSQHEPGTETQLGPGLWSISIDPDAALLEWLQALGGRVSGRVLASSSTFQYFAAAAPGAKELVTMVKVWQLTRGAARRSRSGAYDLVVLDAPATGHALGMLGSPHTFGAIARVGPIAGHTREVQELLEDPAASAYVAVALASEMAVTEVLELQDGLRRLLGREIDRVIVNALTPRRFTATELGRVDALRTLAGHSRSAVSGAESTTIAAAAAAARSVHERGRFQHNQLARLRRRGHDVAGVPVAWDAKIDAAAIRAIAARLARRL